jgi:ubiquinone/menaquinone biosynthesis C-methylase UbiE
VTKIRLSYNQWADTYDTMANKTRDLEAVAIRKSLAGHSFDNVLEIGCGTGKNTIWLMERARSITCVDFSSEMLNKAKGKINDARVRFVEADILNEWSFAKEKYDLVSFSLVLEHIRDVDSVFAKAQKFLRSDGHLYLGELHPFRQYLGSKAKYESDEGMHELECYVHNISEFFKAGTSNGMKCVDISEWGDVDADDNVPRLVSMLFQKN